MLIGEAKCIDDHFFCLLRLVVMSVLKSKKRGEYIHINSFEFVGQFFQGHGIAPICYYDFASRDLVSEPIWHDAMKRLPWTYFIYRAHSTERALCRDFLTPSYGICWPTSYE